MSKPTLFTVLSPGLLELYDLEGSITVIIDVFRATSTIATALNNGAVAVYPVADIDECKAKGLLLNAVTAGERDGKVIDGLQHGNSPAEYSANFIHGKILVLTTTNGTKLLHMALRQHAEVVITGTFPNLSAVCNYIRSAGKNVILACSAWRNKVNIEDALFAGAVVQRVRSHFDIQCDSSLMVESMYRANKHTLQDFVRQTTHWHRLQGYGLEKDLDYCISEDVAPVLPVYQKETGALMNQLR